MKPCDLCETGQVKRKDSRGIYVCDSCHDLTRKKYNAE